MSDQSGAVINDDLKIAGQGVKIISQGKLEIDCEFDGDVSGTEVVIGKRGKVTGTVSAERVVVIGRIFGGIHGKSVALKSSARVEGDIHHMALTVDIGAAVIGRCMRTANV
jgi:cytoskeletal protein CcmA (bactofilin family)